MGRIYQSQRPRHQNGGLSPGQRNGGAELSIGKISLLNESKLHRHPGPSCLCQPVCFHIAQEDGMISRLGSLVEISGSITVRREADRSQQQLYKLRPGHLDFGPKGPVRIAVDPSRLRGGFHLRLRPMPGQVGVSRLCRPGGNRQSEKEGCPHHGRHKPTQHKNTSAFPPAAVRLRYSRPAPSASPPKRPARRGP